uniref:Intraflagellar transport protein 56 n=1 Tax=Globodera rostochiensis TaxID=31243 RepID=A0A914I0P0_GLORO
MLLSRFRPGRRRNVSDVKAAWSELQKIDQFLDKRDYTGAISILEHARKTAAPEQQTNLAMWLGYCQFHAANFRKACEAYEALIGDKNCPAEMYLNLGCAYYFLGMQENARKMAEKGPKNPLQNRLLFHVAHKLTDEKNLLLQHSQLKDTAIDVYKKLDYYDVSLEMLQSYLDKYSDSPIAVNLKACNQYRLYNSKAAENELKMLKDLSSSELSFAKDIILHNKVVFRNGDGALQLLPTLKNDTDAAFVLMNHLDPQSTYDFLLKAITHCMKGNENDSKELLKAAAQYFKVVGESPAECDTIIGRQSMASAYFLRQQYEEVLVYLDSIKTFFANDDTFNFNYGQTQLLCENFAEAQDALRLITGHNLISNLTHCLCIARAYIANKKGKAAWNMYQKERHIQNSQQLLKLIATDSYRAEDYVTAAKAFDELAKRGISTISSSGNDADGDGGGGHYAVARRAACVGVVKMFAARQSDADELREAMKMLARDKETTATNIVATVKKWAADIGVYF